MDEKKANLYLEGLTVHLQERLGLSPKATLEAACQLLHDPPGPHASPLAAEQWRHDVDQLIIAAINTLPHGGGGGRAGETPWWGARAISGILTLTGGALVPTVGTACVIDNTHSKSRYDGFVGRTQVPSFG
jgi:hypothetical protein